MAWIRRLKSWRLGRKTAGNSQRGMTLVEIMVVVAIIGMIMGAVGVVAYNQFKKAQLKEAERLIVSVQQALVHYAMDNPRDPCPADLTVLRTERIINKDPIDPWGTPLIYTCPGENDPDGADISSAGPDRREGTEDDIHSWEL